MAPDISRISSVTQLPRVLIIENDFSVVEPLINTFSDRRLDFDFDACTSFRNAAGKLSASPYQLIISGVHIAEMDDFLLLKRTQALEAFVPVVVTASASRKETARRVLAEGAFDLIPTPLDHEETVCTIRLALWQSKLKELIANKEKAVDRYRKHMGDYPGAREEMEESFNRTLAAVEKSIACLERTFLRIEESTVWLSDFATRVEHEARTRALERLDSLHGLPG